MEALLNYLNGIAPLSKELVQFLAQNLESLSLKKKEYLLKKGQVCNKISFIQQGLFRSFYEANEKETSSWFMKEGDVIISVESFFRQINSYESIQAIEDSFVFFITYPQLQYAYKHFIEFNIIGRVLTENYYILSEQRLFGIRSLKAEERYKYLLEIHPELILRVPSQYIASYLSVTPETLSRIKSHK